jgi:raffinose/stachyose/melibiose transport system substrate-binding protein
MALAVAGTLVALAGCAGATPASSGSTDKVSGTLNILVPSAAGSDAGFKAVNAAFEKKYPDAKIVFTTVPTNNWASVESSRLSAGNVDVLVASPIATPAYVPAGSESFDAKAADAGTFVDLSNESFMKNWTPTVIDALKYKGKDYSVPTGLSYYTGVFYNKDLFAKQGLQVPTTWTEFVALADKLKAAGVAPLGIGGKDSWPAGLAMLAAVQGAYPGQSDKADLAEQLWKQKAKLTDPKLVDVLKKVDAMYGYAEPNFAGVAYSDVPSLFANGAVAMTPDGTWNQTTIDAAVAGKFSYGYFPIPTSDKAADNATLGGKVEIRLSATTNSKNKAAALAYLEFFSQPENYKLFIADAGFAPAQAGLGSTPFLDSIKDYTKSFSLAWDNIWTPSANAGPAAKFPFNYVGVAPLGTDTPEKAADVSQKDWSAAF